MLYMLWINNIIVKNEEEYDFLNEMYPDIKELYNRMWYLQKNSGIKKSFEQIDRINRIKLDIQNKLKMHNIPEYVLFKKEEDKYIEPVSGLDFNIVSNNIRLRQVEEEVANDYIQNLTIEKVDFLNEKMTKFKKIINSNKKIIK